MSIELFLREAYGEAQYSDDPNTRNGAILTQDDVIIARGSNRLPPKINKTAERLKDKYRWLLHAEQSVLMEAAFAGHSTFGSTMYCPWAACSTCAKLIVAAGVKSLVVHKELIYFTPERWQEEVNIGWEMMNEAGIEIVQYSGVLGVTHLFGGLNIDL